MDTGQILADILSNGSNRVHLIGVAGSGMSGLAGLLLALGPLFAIFLLFEGTRGLFEGWVRGLAGAALGHWAPRSCWGSSSPCSNPGSPR